MKKVLSVLLVLATLVAIMSVSTVSASAASTTAYDALSTSTYAKVYTLSSAGTTIPYTDKSLSTRGSVTYGKSSSAYIDNKTDELYLCDVGVTNGKYWAYVSYPVGVKRAYAYIALSAITGNNGSHTKSTSTGKFNCSYRKGVSASSNYYVAKGDTVYLIDTNGSQYQILYPISNGKWRIGFCAKSDYERYCNPDVAVTSVTMRYSSYTLKGKGNTISLVATVNPGNATNKSLRWTSSNTSVATVDSTGKVTSVGAGTATITATASNGKKATATIKVVSVVATKVSINASGFVLSGTGTTKTLKATVTPSNATDKITWKSSNTSVATVDQSGKVTAVNNGTATITATATSGKRASVTVTCKNCSSYSVYNNVLTVNGVSMTEYRIGGTYIDSYYAGKINRNLGASQCFGYARYIQYKLYGKDSYNNPGNFQKTYYNGKIFTSTTDLKNAITSAGVGAHIRTSTKNGGCAHSMVIVGITANGFTVTDANGSATHNLIQIKEYTWSGYINGKTSNGATSTYNRRGLEYIETYKK